MVFQLERTCRTHSTNRLVSCCTASCDHACRNLCRAHPRSDGTGLRMLEVGAGTGRFATFVRDNYPRADLTVSELSPFYLQEARDQMAHWQAQRDRYDADL